MSNEVIISARAELDDVVKALRQVENQGKRVQETMADTGDAVTKKLRDNTKQTQRFLEDLKDFARRTAEEVRGSFEGLAKAAAMKLGDKIGTEMKSAVTGAQQLNNTLRKVGNTLGLTGDDFVRFQTDMAEGLGKLGFDAETASRALEGLGETQVRSKEALLDYAKASALLAGTGKERGQEGAIAKGIAGVITSRGGDVNDRGQQQQVINSALGVMLSTGKTATAALDGMRAFFDGLASDKYRNFDPKTYKGMALAESVSPGAMDFFKGYNNSSALERLPASAQGIGGAFNADGVDVKFLRDFLKRAMGRINFSPEDAMKTFGLDASAAKGAVRLAQNLDKLEDAQKRAAKQTKTLGEAYEDSLGLGEAAQGGFNRVKGMAAGPLAAGTNAATNVTKRIAKGDFSDLKENAGLIAGIGFLGMAGGMSSLGKIFGKGGAGSMLGKSLAVGAAAEALTGQKTIPVFVVNYAQMGGGGGMMGPAGALGGATAGGGMFGKVGAALGLAGIAITAAAVTIDAIEANTMDASGKSWGTRTAGDFNEKLKTATLGHVDLADGIHRMIEALTGAARVIDNNTSELKKNDSPKFKRKELNQTPLGKRGPQQ